MGGLRGLRGLTALTAIATVAAMACGGEGAPGPSTPPEPPPPDAPAIESRLPTPPGSYAPSFARLVGDAGAAANIGDVAICGECHEDVYELWRGSAHARSSFDNPWYRVVVEAVAAEGGAEATQFCGGCHDPALLFTGGLLEEVRPDDPRATAGITCLVCHGIVEASADGNGSYTLRVGDVPLPDPADPEEIQEHIDALTPDPLRTDSLCGACHRSFLSEATGNGVHLPGIDDLGSFASSAFAGDEASLLDEPIEASPCRGCHMPLVDAPRGDMGALDGRIASHRWAGAQTAMASQVGPEQLAAVQDLLRDSATIDIAAARAAQSTTLPADGAPVQAGTELVLDVVLRNTRAGHRLPGGARDVQDTWVEVVIRDSDGRLVAEAGADHERGEVDDATAFRLRSLLLDEDGIPEELHRVHRFRGLAFDRTLAPRDAALVRYRLSIPETIPWSLPLRVEATLRHRRHNRQVQTAACEASRTERGLAFTANAESRGRPGLDACAEQPVTRIAQSVIWLGAGSEERAGSGRALDPTGERLYDHALALTHELQERLDDARPSLAAALEAFGDDDRQQAAVHALLASVAGRQGRVAEALEEVGRAEALVGRHPALARLRGDAYAQVWRWPEAAVAYRQVTEMAPGNTQAYRDLARALGSTQDDEGALRAASAGLALNPRDTDMLRSQSLALSSLGADEADAAREAALAFRRPDDRPRLLRQCQEQVPGCNRDRQPIPEIALRAH